MAHNGMLATVYWRLKSEQQALDAYVASLPGGREAALADAAERQAQLEARAATTEGVSPAGTPGIFNDSGTGTPSIAALMTPGHGAGLTSYELPADALRGQLKGAISTSTSVTPSESSASASAAELRKRSKKAHTHTATDALPAPQADLPVGTSLEPSHTTTPHAPRAPNPLAWSSNERVAVIARNIDAMEDELRSNGAKGLVWPQNVTYRHFTDYLFIPTLVYQLEYPRTAT
jgi:sterol O-acyltransferase